MEQQPIAGGSSGNGTPSEYVALYELIVSEVENLTADQLDWESNRWKWSRWSIRRQLSHMASLIYRWLLVRWGDTLFPDGDHGVEDIEGLASSEFDRRMDETRYWELLVIMKRLKDGFDLAQRVLAERSVEFLRSHNYLQIQSPQWHLMIKAHPTGVTQAADKTKGIITVEATIRHIYFEEITHFYNIQRLKRAQGLPTEANVPRVGYWILDGWDTSEPI